MTTDGNDLELPPRTGKGRFTKTLEGAERDAEACRLYVEGKTYQQVSDALGYGGKQNAHRAITKALQDTIKAPAEELRAREILRAEEVFVMARDIARTTHLAHSGGKLINIARTDGQPGVELLQDDMPRLAAMDRMLKASERIAKLTGLDAATKVHNLSLAEIQEMIEQEERAIREAEEGGEDG